MTSNWLNYESRRSLLGNGVFQHVPDTASRLRDSGIEVLMIGSSPIFPSEVPLLALAKGGPAKDDVFHAHFSKMFDALFRNLLTEGTVFAELYGFL
jgi:hypothetical protein